MVKIKLNLGSGDVKLPGFTNLDGKFGDDITNLIYENESVSEIYASHVLEYFDQIEVIDVLREWYRVLEPKGIIRIAVPDFEKLTQLYLGINKINLGFKKTIIINEMNELNIRDIIGPIMGRMDMDGMRIYHKQIFDYQTLSQLLYHIGFKGIKRYDCEKVKPFNKIDDQSHAFLPHMDKTGTLVSLNVEGIK